MAQKSRKAKIDEPAEGGAPGPQSVNLGGLNDIVGYQIRRANGRSVALWENLLSGRGVAWGQYSILKIVNLNPGLIQKEIASIARIDQTTIVPLISHLEKAGLVERTRDTRDGRNIIVKCTPAGLKLLKRVDPLVEVHDRELTRGLSPDERATLLRLLSRVSALPITGDDAA